MRQLNNECRQQLHAELVSLGMDSDRAADVINSSFFCMSNETEGQSTPEGIKQLAKLLIQLSNKAQPLPRKPRKRKCHYCGSIIEQAEPLEIIKGRSACNVCAKLETD